MAARTKQRQTRAHAETTRRVAVVTGTRAEFGLLESTLRAMGNHANLEPQLIVTGMHLLRTFGRTVDQIRDAGWRIDAEVPMQRGTDGGAAEAEAVGRGVTGLARAFDRLDPQIVLVLGDRIEAFAAASAAATGRRILAHIHGGDRAPGDLDESLRNAITRLAHVHFVASAEAQARLKRMGEPPGRIHRVGAPGLDDIRRFQFTDRQDPTATTRWLKDQLGVLAESPFAVVLQHARGRAAGQEETTMRHMVQAVERAGLGGVAIYPNTDPGHSGILRVLSELQSKNNWRVVRSLPREHYLRLLSRAAVLIGNSSGGVIETASLGLPTINVGPRQQGRLRCGANVVDCRESPAAMTRALRGILSARRPRPRRSAYGDGRAGERIAARLARLIITPRLRQKLLTY